MTNTERFNDRILETVHFNAQNEIIYGLPRDKSESSKAVSVYSHDIWYLEGGTRGTSIARRRLDFSRIPLEFLPASKVILWLYMKNGRKSRRPPTSGSLVGFHFRLRLFLEFVKSVGVLSLANVRTEHCLSYARYVREISAKHSNKRLSDGEVLARLAAVETVYDVTSALEGGLKAMPWPHTSSRFLATGSSSRGSRKLTTLVIPDEILAKIFRLAMDDIDGSERLLDIRDNWIAKNEGKLEGLSLMQFKRHLSDCGWTSGVKQFKDAVARIRSSCYVVIATLSGCRNHEILNMKCGSTYSTSLGGEEAWWMKSESSKFHTGACVWMIPRAAVNAITVMERWSKHLRRRAEELCSGTAIEDVRVRAEARRHLGSIFLSRKGNGPIFTLNQQRLNFHLRKLARDAGVDWDLKSHQFRRTFAVYAARSHLGDLRYLRDHFKHLSLDMTLAYAESTHFDRDLAAAVSKAVSEIKISILDGWMKPETALAGGVGNALRRFRDTNPVKMYRSRSEMLSKLADSINLRSTGHGWCTAALASDCVGSGSLEPLRCSGCQNSVISREDMGFYTRALADLEELSEIPGTGRMEKARVQRDLTACLDIVKQLANEDRAG